MPSHLQVLELLTGTASNISRYPREAAIAVRPARALDRRLVERVLGVALACAGALTLAILLPRRRPPDDPEAA